MAKLISKPAEWSIQVKCKGGCKHTYEYSSDEIYMDEFKVSGYFFDGSAVCRKLPYIICENCGRLHTLEKQLPPKHVLDKARSRD